MERQIKFIVSAVRWFDKVNGTTYHSCRITRTDNGMTLCCPFQFGFGGAYRQTALRALHVNGWVSGEYTEKDIYQYERENNYPIYWYVYDGLKRECIENGKA